MREDDGRKLDHKTLEEIRLRAVRRVEAGEHPKAVARALGMTASAVYSWIAKARSGGIETLLAKSIPGRPTKLSGPEVRKVYDLVVGSDPRQLRFAFALWTREMVAELIAREFSVVLSLSSVGRLLRSLGLSPQRPLFRAYQQDPEAVEAWKNEQYPQIRTQAGEEGAEIFFCDEASVRSDFHSGTTWAPVGQTPVIKTTGARFSVNLVSAVTPKGKLRFSVVEGTLTAPKFIEFCRRLCHDVKGPVFLIVDGHPVHRSKAVKSFVASTEGKLRLFYLPSYSPELNPDEWVWKNVNHDRVGRIGVAGPDDLKAKAFAALRRLQRYPELVIGFFRDPDLSYICA
jgi:transposase